jgi:hypothetical protein
VTGGRTGDAIKNAMPDLVPQWNLPFIDRNTCSIDMQSPDSIRAAMEPVVYSGEDSFEDVGSLICADRPL